MPGVPVLDIAVLALQVLLLLVMLYHPHRKSIAVQMRPRFFAHKRPSLPEGHNWPDWHDSHDGVFEKWVCRDCGAEHLRKMAD